MNKEAVLDLLTTQEAKDLYEAEYSLIALKAGSKEPAVRWKEFVRRRPSSEEQAGLVKTRTQNYGVLVGEAHRLLVLDLDAEDALNALGTDALIPETVTVQTSRGKHIYFTHPHVTLKSKCNSLPNVDLKTSGYVTIAGSTHPSGAKYSYLVSPQQTQIAECPAWIVDLYGGRGDGIRHVDSFQVLIEQVRNASEGSRNNTVFSAARKLKESVENGQLDREEVIQALAAATSLPEEEAERAARNGLTWWPAQIDTERLALDYFDSQQEVDTLHRVWSQFQTDNCDLSQVGMAQWFNALYGGVVRYDHAMNLWYIWSGRVWKPDVTNAIIRAASDAVTLRMLKLRQIGRTSDESTKKLKSYRGLMPLRSMLVIAQSLRPITMSGTEWNPTPHLLCVQNGVVDLRTRELLPAMPEMMINRIARVNYNPEASCIRFDRFTDEITAFDDEYRRYLQLAAGYSITGETSERVFLLCLGSSTNGKTRFIEAMRAAIGDLGLVTSWQTFDHEFRNSHTQSLERLDGARFVSVGEGDSDARWNVGRIKSVVGGEDITARAMYKSDRQFRPVCKLWFTFNHRPRVDDTSDAFWQRCVVLPFNVSFIGREDHSLEETLNTELEGILAWMIDGAHRWYQGERLKTSMPDCVIQEQQRYKDFADPLNDFLDAVCEIDHSAQVRANDLWLAYRGFCDDAHIPPQQRLTRTRFREAVLRRFTSVRQAVGIYYQGLKLRSNHGLGNALTAY